MDGVYGDMVNTDIAEADTIVIVKMVMRLLNRLLYIFLNDISKVSQSISRKRGVIARMNTRKSQGKVAKKFTKKIMSNFSIAMNGESKKSLR